MTTFSILPYPTPVPRSFSAVIDPITIQPFPNPLQPAAKDPFVTDPITIQPYPNPLRPRRDDRIGILPMPGPDVELPTPMPRPIDSTPGAGPRATFVAHVDAAHERTRAAVANLTPPPRGSMAAIIDPRVPAVANARLAIAELDQAANLQVEQGALIAVSNARRELLQAAATLENDHPSLAPAVTHFNSTLNWLQSAKNIVTTPRGL